VAKRTTGMARQHRRGNQVEDLIYFTQAIIAVADIAHLAAEAGFRPETSVVSPDASDLRIYHGGKVDSWHRPSAGAPLEIVWRDDSWIWHDWRNWRNEEVVEPDREWRLADFDPVTVFLVSYRPGSLPSLKRLLKSLLRRYGGWVAADEGMPPFEVENIDSLEYHWLRLADVDGKPL
jgi:hypothetical protein